MKNKFYVRPPQPSEASADTEAGSFDIDKMAASLETILVREVRNLMSESSSKKLSAASARDLVTYIELFEKLKRKRDEEVGSLTEEQLKKLATPSE